MADIRFRPHHFLCTVGFEGKGYSPEFVAGYSSIARRLRESPEGDATEIEVVAGSDSICGPCPNRRGEVCDTEEKIASLDRAHSRALGFRAGEKLTWAEAKRRIRERMAPEKFPETCGPCSWLPSGMCEKALRKLKAAPLAALLSVAAAALGSSAPARADAIADVAARQAALRAKIVGKTKAPKAAKTLAAASKLLDEGKFETAARTASGAEGVAEFADHAYALHGLASLARAEELAGAKDAAQTDWTKVGALAERSAKDWTRILESYLYSPWWTGAAREIAKGELVSALSMAERKKTAAAVALYEKAFRRLEVDGTLSMIRGRHVDSYASLCQAKKTELCTAWIVRLANLYSKNSAESKILSKRFPDEVAAAKPFFANSKVTIGYKQKDADEDAFDKAFPLIVSESWKDAIAAFTKFLEDYPRSTHRFRARYWLAYAQSKKGMKDEAATNWRRIALESPLTFQGLLSMWAIQQPPEDRFQASAPELVDHDDAQTPVEAARLGRARKLVAAKADRLAAMDLRSIRSRDSASGPYLMWLSSLASVSGAHLATFSILSDLIARSDEIVYTQEGLDLVFPLVEWPTIERLSTAAGVDPILTLSLIKQESAFDREAGSSVGAVGFMQLMSFTASDVESDVERRDLLETETNVRIGTKYLRKLIDRYKGNVALALAAYNAGPSAVGAWVREGKASRSFPEFVEQVPYRETRDYVGTIFRNYVWYRWRLKGEKVSDFSAFWPTPASEKTAPSPGPGEPPAPDKPEKKE